MREEKSMSIYCFCYGMTTFWSRHSPHYHDHNLYFPFNSVSNRKAQTQITFFHFVFQLGYRTGYLQIFRLEQNLHRKTHILNLSTSIRQNSTHLKHCCHRFAVIKSTKPLFIYLELYIERSFYIKTRQHCTSK